MRRQSAQVRFRVGPFMLSGWMWIVLVLVACVCCGLVTKVVGQDLDQDVKNNPLPTYDATWDTN
jgi:hypothetical protein